MKKGGEFLRDKVYEKVEYLTCEGMKIGVDDISQISIGDIRE